VTKPYPILVSIDANEAHRLRAIRIRKSIESDEHFLLGKVENLSHDIRFQSMDQTLNIELKDFTDDHQSDYVASIINPEGRLYQQVLTGRELQDPLIIIVLGGDSDVAFAIAKAVSLRGFRGLEAADKIIEYTDVIEDFEANCEGCNIRVWRLQENPYRRMLLRVRKILNGGDLSGFRPSPAYGERKFAGLSLLIGNGIGPSRARSILERFNLTLEPKEPDTYLNDCNGIGPKLALVIQEAFNLHHEVAIRPKMQKGHRRVARGRA
jgi:hypothetical protein